MAFTDDFNRADSATVGNNWDESLAASKWSILSNKLRANNTGDFRTTAILRPASENFANGTLEVEFTRSDTSSAICLIARKQTGYPQYMAWIWGADFYISYINSVGDWIHKAQQTNITALNTAANTFKMKFTLNGTTLTARLEGVTNPGLLSEISCVDSSITVTGRHGLSKNQAGTADFDNFASGALVDATKSITDDGSGADAIDVIDTSNIKNPSDTGTGVDAIGISVNSPVPDAGTGQDSVSITVFIALGDSGTGDDTPSIVQPAMLGLLERFDGTLANWTLDQTGGTAQIQTVNNDEKLVLNDTSGSALVSATRAIEGQAAPFCIEVDIYAGTGAIGLLEALDADNNVLFSIKADAGAGQGTFDTNNDAASTFALTANKYYQIVFYCDTLSDTVKAWYMYGAGGAPSTWTAIGAAKSYTGALVSKIRLTTDAAATGEARFDEVKVFRPNVFCIGDSNTAGYATGPAYWNPSPEAAQRLGSGENEEHSYPHWLSLKYTPDQWAANRGLNSDQSSHVDNRIQSDVIDQGAQAVVILIGTNDISAGVALATIEANIQSAAGKAATAGLTVCLCSVPPANGWDSSQDTKRNSLNAWIQSHCSANGYRFADVYNAVRDSVDPNIINPAYDAGDGLHFTTTGLQVIADIVYSALLETKTLADTAGGADSIEVRNLVALAESALGADALDILGIISVSDSAAGADSLSIFAAIQLLEAAAAIEGLVAGGMPVLYSLADSGAGVDSVSAIIREGATIQDVYNLTLTRLASSAYVLPDNAGITSLLEHAVSMSKWKNNKLARTSVAGTVETWVLYDDDGMTPLLTWTHDASTRTRNRAY